MASSSTSRGSLGEKDPLGFNILSQVSVEILSVLSLSKLSLTT